MHIPTTCLHIYNISFDFAFVTCPQLPPHSRRRPSPHLCPCSHPFLSLIVIIYVMLLCICDIKAHTCAHAHAHVYAHAFALIPVTTMSRMPPPPPPHPHPARRKYIRPQLLPCSHRFFPILVMIYVLLLCTGDLLYFSPTLRPCSHPSFPFIVMRYIVSLHCSHVPS